MKKIFAALMAPALVLAIFVIMPALALSIEKPAIEKQSAPDEKAVVDELESLMRANELFLKGAVKVLGQANDEAASALLEHAFSSARTGETRYRRGEHREAIEAISDSTHNAIRAIITAKSGTGMVLREWAAREGEILRAGKDRERKKRLIKKGMDEVEAFIETADRLLKEHEDAAFRVRLNEAGDLHRSAKGSAASGRYDAALDHLRGAYAAATDVVKGIKRTRGDILTFPRPDFKDTASVLNYEIKKNEAYVFFAAQIIDDEDREARTLLRDGEAKKNEAAEALNSGDTARAIEILRASTGLYVEAVRKAVK